MNKRDLEKAMTAEVERWPGVEVTFADGGKHPKAKLAFGGKLLNVVYPGTPGDGAHGLHNTLGDLRRAMKKLGAVRDKPEPTRDEDEAPYRKPNDGANQRPSPVKGEPSAPIKSVGEQLASKGLAPTSRLGKSLLADVSLAAKPSRTKDDGVTVPKSGQRRATGAISDDDGDKSPDDADALREAFKARVASIVDGIYFGLPDDVYHAVPRLSSSGIQKLCVSAGTFWRGSWLDPNPPEKDEEALWKKIGRAYHTARLEPHLFEQTYVRELDKADAPKGTLFTGNEMGATLEEMGLKKSGSVMEQADRLADNGFDYRKLWPLIKAQWDEERGTRIALPAKHYDQMIADRDRISANSQVAPLLQGGEAEVSIFWTDEYGVQMKCRVDYLTRDWWCDFKTFDNSKGKKLKQALVDAVRYNRYYIQAPVYREGIERVRVGSLPIIEVQTDDQRALIAYIQLKPAELRCWYVFQEKGGVPNLLAYEFPFYTIPYSTLFQEGIAKNERQVLTVREATKHRSGLFMKGAGEVLQSKKEFVLYSQVYGPGEPWAPIDAIGCFDDDSFHPYWLSGELA